jgi:hypothetical protein
MSWRVIALAAAATLLLPGAASAKQVTHVLVVGVGGRAVDLGGGWSLYQQLRPFNESAATPSGSYLLLYPLMERGVPMQPGRYYPAVRVACWSWSLRREGCVEVGQLPASWSQTDALTAFSSEPTTIRALTHAGRPYTVPSNSSVAVELALLQRPAGPAPRTACAWRLRATWRGPAAAEKPRKLCLRANGLAAGGRLYAMASGAVASLHFVG